MSEPALDKDDFEDERLIQLSQVKREYIITTLMDPTNSNKGIPKDEGSRIMLMQSIDGLSSVALKRKSMRQKAKAEQDGNEIFKNLAAEVIKSMVGRTNGTARTAPVALTGEHKQTYVEGELSTDQNIVDESHIIAARNNLNLEG